VEWIVLHVYLRIGHTQDWVRVRWRALTASDDSLENALLKIAASCGKRRQKSGAVERPVGRLLERNTGAAPRLFDVQVEVDAQGFTQLRSTRMASWREWRAGVKGAASCAAM
jgi:hypothetical protein